MEVKHEPQANRQKGLCGDHVRRREGVTGVGSKGGTSSRDGLEQTEGSSGR
jgi:hypothetical protein